MTELLITEETTFGELLRTSPKAGKFLKQRFNLGCVGCGGADNETIAQGARAHGLDVGELIRELKENL